VVGEYLGASKGSATPLPKLKGLSIPRAVFAGMTILAAVVLLVEKLSAAGAASAALENYKLYALMIRAVFTASFVLALGLGAVFGSPACQAFARAWSSPSIPSCPRASTCSKDGKPFRLSPIQAVLPLHVDRFYRERTLDE